jgi:hypothetical protein
MYYAKIDLTDLDMVEIENLDELKSVQEEFLLYYKNDIGYLKTYNRKAFAIFTDPELLSGKEISETEYLIGKQFFSDNWKRLGNFLLLNE